MTLLKKRTAETRRAQSLRDYQRKIFAIFADYQPLSAVKISFFQFYWQRMFVRLSSNILDNYLMN